MRTVPTLAVAAAVVLLGGVARAIPGDPALVATGDAAGGVAGATFRAFGPPAVGDGTFALRASLTPGAGGVTAANDTGVWIVTPPGASQLVAREGAAAPGVPTAFASFGEPVTTGGRVAFVAKVRTGQGVKGSSATGIWSDSAGSLQLVARTGLVAPGASGAKFAKFLAVGLLPKSGVVFAAQLKGAPKSADVGVWVADADGHLELVERESFSVSAGGVAKRIAKLEFLAAAPLVGADSRGFAGDGTVAMRATFTDRSQGIVTYRRTVLFEDDFTAGLGAGWSVTRPDAAYYAAGLGQVDLRLSNGDLFEGDNSAKNVFLRDAPAGDWSATLRLGSFAPDPDAAFPQIDVLAYDDDDNLVRAAYAAFGGARGFELGTEENASFGSDVRFGDRADSPFWLRLTKVGNLYVELVSSDGISFDFAAGPREYGDGSPAKIGFVGMADGTESVHAYVESFTVEATARTVAAGGDPTPGIPGARFKAFGSPALAPTKEVAFVGTLAAGTGVSKANDTGVWNAGILVAREGSPAPGTTGTFAAFGAPVTYGPATSVFPATLKKGGGVTSANAAGVWRQKDATTQLVVRQGDPAPTLGGATFKAITGVGTLSDGSVVFAATLAGTGITGANDGGVWRANPDGAVFPVLREGDDVLVGSGTKTAASVSFLAPVKGIGQRRAFDADGVLALRVVFTDGTEAVVRFLE